MDSGGRDGVGDPGGGGVRGDGRGRGRDARGEGAWVLCRGARVQLVDASRRARWSAWSAFIKPEWAPTLTGERTGSAL